MGSGSWGLLVLTAAFALWFPYPDAPAAMRHAEFVAAVAALGVHALMFMVGVTRSTRRYWWLARVVRGKVPGWLVCERVQFSGTDLESLDVFCRPWFARTPAQGRRVLARGTQGGAKQAYRGYSPIP